VDLNMVGEQRLRDTQSSERQLANRCGVRTLLDDTSLEAPRPSILFRHILHLHQYRLFSPIGPMERLRNAGIAIR
jgi:hypothetical protein